MRENASRITESRTHTKDGTPWPVLGSNITPIIVERERSTCFEKRDTDVSSMVWIYLYEKQGREERTQLRSELKQEALLRDNPVFDKRVQPNDKVEDSNETRIVLLARKYASSQFSPEESARLDILTEKVQRLMPSVTDDDLAKMQKLSSRLDDISAVNNAIRRKYGLEKD